MTAEYVCMTDSCHSSVCLLCFHFFRIIQPPMECRISFSLSDTGVEAMFDVVDVVDCVL